MATPNFDRLIDGMVEHQVSDIRDYINMGWTKEAAIQYVRERTTLGPTKWNEVLRIIG